MIVRFLVAELRKKVGFLVQHFNGGIHVVIPWVCPAEPSIRVTNVSV